MTLRLARLDGIRGIAILLVIAYHHHLLTSFGWAGVDLFFVLSGYLITRILRETRSSEQYWSRFYIRRAARILPALLITLTLAALISKHANWRGLAGYALFLGNVVNLSPYMITLVSPLWSLAVEEHYYLVWPGFVRTMSRRRLLSVLLGVLLAEPILRLLAARYVDAPTIYYFTAFRLDGIAWGSLLALLSEDVRASHWLARFSGWGALVSAACFGGLTVSFPTFTHDVNSPLFDGVGFSLAALVCFLCVAWVVPLDPGSAADRALSFRPLVYVGRISYGMYLLQQLALTLSKTALHIPFNDSGTFRTQLLFLPDLLLVIGAASGMFYVVEKRAIGWGARHTRMAVSPPPLSARQTGPSCDPSSCA